MKKILRYILLLLSFYTVVVSAGDMEAGRWYHSPDDKKVGEIYWRYDCGDTADMSNVYIRIHGLGVGLDTYTPDDLHEGDKLIETVLERCGLVVLPVSKSHIINDRKFLAWDYTGRLTLLRDISNISNLVKLGKTLFPETPVFLVGGSAGAFMAYRVANEMRLIGYGHLIRGLVMLDGASPYGISYNTTVPFFDGSNYELIQTSFGINYYESDEPYLNLGFNNDNVYWTIPTMAVYSINDPLIPEKSKHDFYIGLQDHSKYTTVLIAGEGHNVGEVGVDAILEWIRVRH